MELLLVTVALAGVAAVVVAVVAAFRRARERDLAALAEYAARRGLRPTDAPLGHTADWWLDAMDIVPAGEQPSRVSVEAGHQGPVSMRAGGRTATVDVAVFEWRHWTRHHDVENGLQDHPEDDPFVAVQMPAPVTAHVVLRDRALRRRKNHVACDDPAVAAALSAPAVEERLDGLLRHAQVELVDDLMVIRSLSRPPTGDSDHHGTAGIHDRMLGLAERVADTLPATLWDVAT